MDKKYIMSKLFAILDKEDAEALETLRQHREEAIRTETSKTDQQDSNKAEASYLADGHQARIMKANECNHQMRNFTVKPCDVVLPGALVELVSDQESRCYFILPGGGGRRVKVKNQDITVISPTAPLYKSMKGFKTGTEVTIGGKRFQIANIW